MAHASHILGMNARNQLYASLNSEKAKRYGFSKFVAKEFLLKHGIPVAQLYGILYTYDELKKFDWNSIEGGFAVKPSNGSAGKGILVIKEKVKGRGWRDITGRIHTLEDLRLHVSDILAGQYSTWGTVRSAIVEERIPIHPDLEQYVTYGTPDVRVILLNKIPIMAMTRLPTKESGGRANLDQGAIGLGIDMGTGKTIAGVTGKKHPIEFFPGNTISVKGIQIPFWLRVLRTAVRVANATGLRYMGADIFLHPEKGPMVAEVNAYPGLSIQLANRVGLRRRLERVEGIEARNVNHAVKIGQSLFAENYPAFSTGEDVPVLDIIETGELFGDLDVKREVRVLVNTGREQSAIAADVAEEMGLVDPQDLLWTQQLAGEGKASVVEVKLKLHDRVIKTPMIVSKKLSGTKYDIHLGRANLEGFLIGVRE